MRQGQLDAGGEIYGRLELEQVRPGGIDVEPEPLALHEAYRSTALGESRSLNLTPQNTPISKGRIRKVQPSDPPPSLAKQHTRRGEGALGFIFSKMWEALRVSDALEPYISADNPATTRRSSRLPSTQARTRSSLGSYG